jgi:hypothetical protein
VADDQRRPPAEQQEVHAWVPGGRARAPHPRTAPGASAQRSRHLFQAPRARPRRHARRKATASNFPQSVSRPRSTTTRRSCSRPTSSVPRSRRTRASSAKQSI